MNLSLKLTLRAQIQNVFQLTFILFYKVLSIRCYSWTTFFVFFKSLLLLYAYSGLMLVTRGSERIREGVAEMK